MIQEPPRAVRLVPFGSGHLCGHRGQQWLKQVVGRDRGGWVMLGWPQETAVFAVTGEGAAGLAEGIFQATEGLGLVRGSPEGGHGSGVITWRVA